MGESGSSATESVLEGGTALSPRRSIVSPSRKANIARPARNTPVPTKVSCTPHSAARAGAIASDPTSAAVDRDQALGSTTADYPPLQPAIATLRGRWPPRKRARSAGMRSFTVGVLSLVITAPSPQPTAARPGPPGVTAVMKPLLTEDRFVVRNQGPREPVCRGQPRRRFQPTPLSTTTTPGPHSVCKWPPSCNSRTGTSDHLMPSADVHAPECGCPSTSLGWRVQCWRRPGQALPGSRPASALRRARTRRGEPGTSGTRRRTSTPPHRFLPNPIRRLRGPALARSHHSARCQRRPRHRRVRRNQPVGRFDKSVVVVLRTIRQLEGRRHLKP